MRITVIIPVFNAEKFLKKAVESVLQFDEVQEIILIDDASPDNGLTICEQLVIRDHRVKLLQHPDKKNHGAGASRNLGLKNASSDYIAFLDADDYYLPNRFDVDKKIFVKYPEADGVYNCIGTKFLSRRGKELYSSRFKTNVTTVHKNVGPEEVFSGLLGLIKDFGSFSLDGLTIKRSALQKLSKWFDSDLPFHQDSEFIIRLSYNARLEKGELERPVALRGVHDDNRITNLKKFSKNYYYNQDVFWTKIYNWAKTEPLDYVVKEHLFCMHLSRNIGTGNLLSSWIKLIKNIAINKRLLTKSIYYDYFHYFLFGRNKISTFILRIKYKLQLYFGISLNHLDRQ